MSNQSQGSMRCLAKDCDEPRLLFEYYCGGHIRANRTNVPIEHYRPAPGVDYEEVDDAITEILSEPQDQTQADSSIAKELGLIWSEDSGVYLYGHGAGWTSQIEPGLLKLIDTYAEQKAVQREREARIDAVRLLIETVEDNGRVVTLDLLRSFQAGQLVAFDELSKETPQ